MEEKTIQPIAENLWWVIPDKLAGVRKPLAEELPELQTLGVRSIVSVMDDPSNLELYKQANLPHLWLPTKGGTPPSREQVQQLQDFIDAQNNQGNGVAIHCTSGRRRTGTAIAAYLIVSGFTYSDAMEKILSVNPEIDLREAQSKFLQDF
ncbi:MAG: protein phosphatase [Okeania sp. SIO2C2]|uniref:phosphatase domain-containing putative toxin n=1 Tax=Okeania sp. SIO2C2 TaxID=2607787 RepID=UPI0013BAA1E1|nr:dual specificity protein phosphatase family protein [Okeania sp. SIO2C2]NEP90442.1 protein phosphatase [Okeania sp. SIO2C2]